MFTSFQLFRISYSELFNAGGLKAEMTNHKKYYKRMNRYTLFYLTFVILPTVIASIYNLFYTWYGRQVYWIDIENLVNCTLTTAVLLMVMFRSQSLYIQ